MLPSSREYWRGTRSDGRTSEEMTSKSRTEAHMAAAVHRWTVWRESEGLRLLCGHIRSARCVCACVWGWRGCTLTALYLLILFLFFLSLHWLQPSISPPFQAHSLPLFLLLTGPWKIGQPLCKEERRGSRGWGWGGCRGKEAETKPPGEKRRVRNEWGNNEVGTLSSSRWKMTK